jgi:protein-tyrosine phosphatase
MDLNVLELLAARSIDGESHRGRQLTPHLLRHADLILGMEYNHVAAIKRMAPEASGKTLLFTKWTDGRDIPDPYRQQRIAFEHAHGLIERNAESWLRYL